MKILLTGAAGFIGRRLAATLAEHGYDLRCVGRELPSLEPDSRYPAGAIAPNTGERSHTTWIAMDISRALAPEDWTAALDGCDVLINAAGLFASRQGNTLENVHALAPRALFEAARREGIDRVIQLSALGADELAVSAYHRSKKAGDDALRQSGLPYTIVQPSLVFGPEGASSRFFLMIASLPVIPLPGRGTGRIQPVHVDDLVQAIVALVAMRGPEMPTQLSAVGPAPVTLRDYYDCLRFGLRIEHPARYVPIPHPVVSAAARIGNRLGASLLNSEAIDMLARGNTADPAPLRRLIGRPPRGTGEFIEPACAEAMATRARAAWLLPMLRWSIAFVWLFTAVVSAFGYPLDDSYALLARAGVPAALQPLALYGASALDLLLGVALLLRRRPRWIWMAQASLMIGYTAIITFRLPEFWLHPYGPLTKNVPILVALWLLCEMEDRPWRS